MLFKATLASAAIITLASAQGSGVCNAGDLGLYSATTNSTSLCCPNPIINGTNFCGAYMVGSNVMVNCFLGQDATPNVPFGFNVPAGASYLNVSLNGEDGQYETYNSSVGPGGLGAYVNGVVQLAGLNGTVLYFFAGAAGGAGGAASVGYNSSAPFNTNSSGPSFPAGANGGGFASVGTCASPNAGPSDCRLAVAAGGGGAGTAILYTGYGGRADDSNNPSTGNGTFGSLGHSFGNSATANGAGGGGGGLYGGAAGAAQIVGGGAGGGGGLSYYPTGYTLTPATTQFDINGYSPSSVSVTYIATNCLTPLQVAAARIQAAIVQLISNQAFNAVISINCKGKLNKTTAIYTCQ